MEVFYIPNHKVILKKRKKKRKLVETQVLKITTTLPANPLEVIKEGTSTTPNEEFEELAQCARAYAFASMDKATKVREFIMKKR